MQVRIRVELFDRNETARINPIDPIDRMSTLRGRVNFPDNRDCFEGFLNGRDVENIADRCPQE